MKRILDNLHVDLVAAVIMVAMVATGYILRFPLPPGTNKYLTLWGLTRHQWGTVHFWISTALLVLVVVHVCLHWKWVVVTIKRRFWGGTSPPKSSLVSGLLTIAFIVTALAFFGWAAHYSVTPIEEPIEETTPPSPSGSQLESHVAGDPSSTPNDATVAFWRDVYPIFERSCQSCHGPRKQISGFRVDRKEDFFEGTTPLIVPGSSSESPLVELLSGRRDIARADVHRLPNEELVVVMAWIDSGAEWRDRPAD
jgi:hypothetical protein